jgi:hypothetical protein
VKATKRKKSKRAVRAARVLWVRGAGRYGSDEMPPVLCAFADDNPDAVFAGMAALVPRSCDVEGHEERIAAHAARVALEDCKGNGSELVCDACGTVAPRKGHMAGRADVWRTPDERAAAAARWACRRVRGTTHNETYCRACFDVWGWPEEYRKRVELFAAGLIRPDPEPEVA